MSIFRRGPLPLTGALNARGYELITIFDQYRALFGTDTIYSHSYYGRRIGNRNQTFEWYQFEWLSVTFPCKVTMIQRQITWKWYNIQLSLQWPTNKKYDQWLWTTLTPSFKVTPFFDAEYLRNGTTYRNRFNEMLIGTNIRPTQQCHFEWPWVTLSHLAKYSMTRSVARSLCDSELLVELITTKCRYFYMA